MADADHKFMTLVNGAKKLLQGITTSAGAADGGKMVRTDPTTGKLDASLLPSELGGTDQSDVEATETLAIGQLVHVWDDAGNAEARLANATDASKPARGFVKAGFTAGQTATVYYDGVISGLSGLTPGADYWLDTTGGGITDDVSGFTTGNIVQPVGFAKSATELIFEPGEVIEL